MREDSAKNHFSEKKKKHKGVLKTKKKSTWLVERRQALKRLRAPPFTAFCCGGTELRVIIGISIQQGWIWQALRRQRDADVSSLSTSCIGGTTIFLTCLRTLAPPTSTMLATRIHALADSHISCAASMNRWIR